MNLDFEIKREERKRKGKVRSRSGGGEDKVDYESTEHMLTHDNDGKSVSD